MHFSASDVRIVLHRVGAFFDEHICLEAAVEASKCAMWQRILTPKTFQGTLVLDRGPIPFQISHFRQVWFSSKVILDVLLLLEVLLFLLILKLFHHRSGALRSLDIDMLR